MAAAVPEGIRDWADYLASGVAPKRRCLIGGNWKCNGTLKEVKTLVDRLNQAGKFVQSSEVCSIFVWELGQWHN